MALFSKKHYELLAKVFNDQVALTRQTRMTLLSDGQESAKARGRWLARERALFDLAEALALALSQDNQAFDLPRFMRDAGLEG